jgi:hypothetical protein
MPKISLAVFLAFAVVSTSFAAEPWEPVWSFDTHG